MSASLWLEVHFLNGFRFLTLSRWLLLGTLVLSAVATACMGAETPTLYGIHDFSPYPTEYLNHVTSSGQTAWITATVAVGHNPADVSGTDFTAASSQGHTVICRINNGYGDDGTIPIPSQYDNFAQRCANFVASSPGCSIWLIGNETNLASEWPLNNGTFPYVSPQDYATCFRKVYNAIKAVHPNDKVISEGLAPFGGPYGAGTKDGYPADGNPLSWVQYMNQMLTAISSTGPLDGIALHVTSRGYTDADVHSTAQISVNGQNLYWSFYCYKDWINYGIPPALYNLPLYITECNGYFYWKGGMAEDPTQHYEPGFVQDVYAEINSYNQSAIASGLPIIHCLNLYRWCAYCDGWNIDGSDDPYKAQILSDLDSALAQHYTWPATAPVIVDDADPGFRVISGFWPAGNVAGQWQVSFRFHGSSPGNTDSVKWTPALPTPGMYKVSVWYLAQSNRATNAPFTVNSLNGAQTTTVNQQNNGSQWDSLGVYPFAASGASVTLSDNAAPAVVIADAVRWDYQGPLPSTGSLTGAVKDTGGNGISGASVSTSPGAFSATSASGGAYTIDGMTPGVYSVTASKPGYLSQTSNGVSVGTLASTINFNLPPLAGVTTIGAAKGFADGTGVALTGKIVTANIGARLWIEEPDRSGAIRVEGTWPSASPGSTVNVTGTLGTDTGERTLTNASLSVSGSGTALFPVLMSNAAVCGPDLNPYTLGVHDTFSSGVNTVGLLIGIWGRVTATGSDFFYVDDGYGVQDGSGNAGVRVSASGISPIPTVGQIVMVKGIARLYSLNSQIVRSVQCGSAGDIAVLGP